MSTKTITCGMVRNLLWSKAQPDGIYIDPEDGTKYDLNNVYDRADATDVMAWKLEKQGYKVIV